MELVSRCVECGLAEPESLASLGGSAPGVVYGILSKSMLDCAEFGHDCMVIGATSVAWDDNPYVVTDDDDESSDSSNES